MITIRFWIYIFSIAFLVSYLIGYFFINSTESLLDEVWFGIIFILLLIYFIVLDRKVIRPLTALRQQVGKIIRGNYTSRIYYTYNDEIKGIVEALNLLTTNISQVINFIKAIESGQVKVEYEGAKNKKQLEKNTLVQALLRLQAQIVQIKQQDKQRSWISTGIANLNYLLRNNQDKDRQEITQMIISQTTQYAEAAQGAIFLVPLTQNIKEAQYLELVGCYACPEDRLLSEENLSINIGEGLVGQAFKEKKTIYLDSVPEGYTQISSGLGTAKPTAIIIMPLQFNQHIEGVLEIAFLNPIAPHLIDFLERVAEIVTAAFVGIRNNEITKRLLRDSQQQTEMLKAQEEEMRQNMEELQATQEEMEKKQQEILLFNTKLEASERVLKKSIDKMKEETDKNKALLQETQQKAEMLKAQEEEMRQNMEELQAAQEELEKRNRELEMVNKRLFNNEAVLKKAVQKSREKERELKEKEKEISGMLEKNKKLILQFRQKVEELDLALERKTIECNKLKKQLNELQQNLNPPQL